MNELQNIQDLIYIIRGQRVMLDFDLAMLYEVETTSRMKRPKKSLPYAFTELGALMLSSVLRSPVADETSIKITRAFVAMRQMLTFSTLPEKVVTLAQELYKLKEEVNEILADQNDINESTRAQLDAISLALSELQASRSQNATLKNRRPIGFIQPKEDEE